MINECDNYDEMREAIFNSWANCKSVYELTSEQIKNLGTVEYPVPPTVC